MRWRYLRRGQIRGNRHGITLGCGTGACNYTPRIAGFTQGALARPRPSCEPVTRCARLPAILAVILHRDPRRSGLTTEAVLDARFHAPMLPGKHRAKRGCYRIRYSGLLA
jgi:hypothetical protein